VRAAFDQLHKEVYGTAATGEIPDIVNVRVMSVAEVAKLDLPELPKGERDPKPVARRKVLFDEHEGYLDTPIYDRIKLGAGAVINGPAVIEQLDSTTVILPGQTAEIERYGNIIIEVTP
jgi:N-methylhydantoinase A